MSLRKLSLVFVGASLLSPTFGGTLSALPTQECTGDTPYDDTPAAKADVIFHGRALDTRGADTELEVVEVVRGFLPNRKVVFKHARAPQNPSPEDHRHYYELTTGKSYLIYANKTALPNVYTQLISEKHCGDSVVPDDP